MSRKNKTEISVVPVFDNCRTDRQAFIELMKDRRYAQKYKKGLGFDKNIVYNKTQGKKL